MEGYENILECGISDEEQTDYIKGIDLTRKTSEPTFSKKSSERLTIVSEDEKEDLDVAFDQDLVEAFLEMEDCLELISYIADMDKARFREIDTVIFQSFKQRCSYENVKKLFKTEKDPFDFNEAVTIVINLVLTTGNFKKISKFVRTQLFKGLGCVKKEHEEIKIDEETTKFLESNWKYLRTDSLRIFTDVTGFELTKEMLTKLIKEYEKNNKPIEAMEIIQEFEIFDVEIDWKKGILTLIDANQWDKLISLLFNKTDLIDYAIGMMSNNKYAKEASVIIDKMGLDILKYPLVLERLQKKAVRYHVYNYKGGPKSHDYTPLWKIEDLFYGLNSMMAYICEDLAFSKSKKESDNKYLKDAKALALRNSIYDQLREDVRAKLDKIDLTEEDMKIDCIEDIFAPLSKPDEDYFRLPSETNVTFIGSEEEIKLAEPLLEATCVGVDCEWRPSLVKFQNTKVALLQIGDKKNVFLFDMKKLNESSVLDELLTKVFNNMNTDVIGMSFKNDLSGMAIAAPNLKFYKRIENFYDVQPMFASIYKKQDGLGLAKICDAVIGKKICKFEQMSNWELRPLRKSQSHYAALDAFILVELFDRMKKYCEENDIHIEDYRNTFTYGGVLGGPKYVNSKVDFNIHTKDIGKSIVKTVKLKPGESLLANEELAKMEKPENAECKFFVDYTLPKLYKLLKHMGLQTFKVNKKQNALERVKLCKQEGLIFVTRDEKRFNKSLSIFAILLRKQDSAEKQFNNIMSYLKVDKQATSADVEAIKETENDADDEDQ